VVDDFRSIAIFLFHDQKSGWDVEASLYVVLHNICGNKRISKDIHRRCGDGVYTEMAFHPLAVGQREEMTAI